jgi:hypothetical protein
MLHYYYYYYYYFYFFVYFLNALFPFQAYEELFSLADVDRDGSISVQEVGFLRKSGLSNEQLGTVRC